MIIWGWKSRNRELSSGEFHCPGCDAPREYRHFRVARYFTLYFIPLFPYRTLGEYVECQRCRRAYNETVLEHRPEAEAVPGRAAVRRDLESGTPLEVARRKLVYAGMDKREAEGLVVSAAGEARWACEACRLSYVDAVVRCSNCHAEAPNWAFRPGANASPSPKPKPGPPRRSGSSEFS